MKVCFVTHASNLTGANQSLLDILSDISRYQVEPHVLLKQHGPIEQELKKRKIPYRIIPYPHEMSGSPLKNVLKQVYYAFAMPLIKVFFSRQNFELIHNNSFLVGVGMEAAYRAGIPYICHNRELVWEDHRIRLLHNDRQLFLLRHAAAAIEISDFVYRKYQNLVPDANYYILRNGINIEKYWCPHGEILKSECIRLIIAGRICKGKGQLEAIKALEILQKKGYNSFSLTVVGGIGEEDYDRQLRQYVLEHHVKHVDFLGFSDLRALREKSDIVLVCSVAEALGRVTIEGQLSGCLVVGAAAGATVELISDLKTGLLYRSGDPEDLALKLLYAADHPEEMNCVARCGQEEAKRLFDVSSYNDRLIEIYKDVLNI